MQIDKGDYKKAQENLSKAEKLLENAELTDFICQALMLRGRTLLAKGGRKKP